VFLYVDVLHNTFLGDALRLEVLYIFEVKKVLSVVVNGEKGSLNRWMTGDR
jgi:hypothetical protein